LRDKYGSKSENLKNIEDNLKELEARVEDNEINASYYDKSTEEADIPEDSNKSKPENEKYLKSDEMVQKQIGIYHYHQQ
jgi:L-lactate utilization protein LutB